MKKIRFIALAVFSAFAMSATAQSYYQQQSRKSSSYYDVEPFSTLYVQFSPSKLYAKSEYKGDGISLSESENSSINALSLGYAYYMPLSESIPLYLDFGAAVQWFFKSKEYKDYFYDEEINEKVKTNLISVKIPINVSYAIPVSDAFCIAPYAGIYGRVNIIGKEKAGDESADMFSKDDYGDAVAKRFQAGWNAGVNFRIANAITVGAGYYMDLLKFQSYEEHHAKFKSHFQGFDITLGFNF